MRYDILGPDDKFRVGLSTAEWSLLLDETFIDDDLTNSVVSDGNKKYINWSMDDLDCVIGYIAEAANHIDNKKIVNRLEKLLDKLEKIEDRKVAKIVPFKTLETNEYVHDWARADAELRTTPYTEEELDIITKGTIGAIDDLAAWKDLVAMVGLEEATLTIRMTLQHQLDNYGINNSDN